MNLNSNRRLIRSHATANSTIHVFSIRVASSGHQQNSLFCIRYSYYANILFIHLVAMFIYWKPPARENCKTYFFSSQGKFKWMLARFQLQDQRKRSCKQPSIHIMSVLNLNKDVFMCDGGLQKIFISACEFILN